MEKEIKFGWQLWIKKTPPKSIVITVWGVVSAAVEQSRRKANMVAQGDGKVGPWGWPQDPSKPKKKYCYQKIRSCFEIR